MTEAEIICYNYGKRLMAESIAIAENGMMPSGMERAQATETEMAAISRLGTNPAFEWIRRGGESVLAASAPAS